MNCGTHYPLAKGVRDYFANDVITAIDIGMVAMSIGTAEQTPMDPLAQIVLMLTQFLPVQKATLAGVGLFGDEHMYPYELRFVGQHLEKASVWNVHKILIVTPANVDVMLPLRIMPNDERAYPLLYQQINNPFGRTVEQVLDAPIALVSDLLKLL